MANSVVVHIDGDSSGYEKALKEVEKEFDRLGKSGKQNISSIEKPAKQASGKIDKLGKSADNAADDINDLGRQSKKAKDNIKDLGDEAQGSSKGISGIGNGLKGLKSNISGSLGKLAGVAGGVAAVGGAAVGVVSTLNNLVESTREYREDMNRLDAAFVSAGKTVDSARQSYSDFYAVLGESDRSVEAVNHLAKLCNTEEELAQWSTICAGVSATFGDSLPIEGLTEAANETAKVGQVTGPLADALNWAGISEDKFNQQLALCNSEQERAALITSTLAGTYQTAATEFENMNADIMESRRVSQEWSDAWAKAAEIWEPIGTKFSGFGADMLNGTLTIVGGIGELISGSYTFKDTIAQVGDEFQTAKEKAQITEDYVTEWYNLRDAIAEGKLPSEELAAAQERIKAVEQWLIDNYGNFITAEEEKNGIRATTVDLIERQADALLRSQQLELERELNSNSDRIPELEQENELLQKNNEELDEQIAHNEEILTKLTDLRNKYDTLTNQVDSGSISNEQYQKGLEGIADEVETLTGKSMGGGGIAGLDAIMDEYNATIADSNGQLIENTKKIEENSSALDTYVSNAKAVIETDLGGTYKDTIATLDLLKKAQDELNEKGEITKDTYDALVQKVPELKDNADSPEFLAEKIEDIETKIKNADDKLRDFNLRVDQSSKEIVIDVTYKVSGMPFGPSTSPFVIPGNAKGTLNAKRGLSAVNERGMELIEGKDGSFRYVDSKGAALTYLNSGDRVYTAEQTKKMFGNIRHLPGFANGLSGAGDKSITFDISGYINSNSAGIGRAIAEELIGGIQTGIDDGKTEVQKVLDGMNEEMLEGEKKYLSEKERIERENYEKEYQEKLANAKDAEEIEKIKQDRIKEEAEQAQQDYLDGLQEAADNERQIYEALQKDIENQKKEIVENFEETAEAAFDAIEEIEQAQTEFADSLRSDDLYETNTLFTLNGEEFTETGLKNWDKENEKLRAYNDTLSQTSERLQGIFGEDADGFDEMMNMLREDPFGEGGKTLELMKNATDEELQKFVSGWQENRNLTAEIAKESFSDETEELKSVLENTFGQVPEDFFNIGDESAEQFGEGFMQKLNEVWQEVRQAVFDSMSHISPAADYIGKFTGSGQVITNKTYSPTYNLVAPDGEDLQSQLHNINAYETRNRMRGGY